MNPGPKTLPSCLYMLSSRFKSRVRFSPGTGDVRTPARLISLIAPRASTISQPAESTPRIRPYRLGPVGRHRQLTLLVRSYNRLRLYLFPPFLRADRNSACNIKLQYPRRIRFAPLSIVCVDSTTKVVALQSSRRRLRAISRLDSFSLRAARLS